MSFDLFTEINWLAAIVAGAVYFGLGALWYSPVAFGEEWMDSMGWQPGEEDPEATTAEYVMPLAAYVVVGIALAVLARATGTDTLGEGIVLGLVVGVGVSSMILLTTALFDPGKKKLTWWMITGGYHELGIILASVIVAIWQ